MEYCVYILYSEVRDTIYIGYTCDLKSRIRSHNWYDKKGWTRNYRPWKVIFVEMYKDQVEAKKREKSLKGGQGREWIHRQIEENLSEFGFISA